MESIKDVLSRMAERQALTGGIAPAEGDGPRADPRCPRCWGRGRVEAEQPGVVTRKVVGYDKATRTTTYEETPYIVTSVCPCVALAPAPVRSAEACGMGGLLEQMTMETFDASELPPALWGQVGVWAAGFPGSLHERPGYLFAGTTGNGKTHLMAAVLHVARERGIRVRCIEETALSRALQATYNADADISEASVLDGLIAVPLLGLDDLGQGYVPGHQNAQDGATWLSSRLYTLLNGRLQACRPTLLTTNVKAAALAARLGDGAASRVDALTLVPFTGRDRR